LSRERTVASSPPKLAGLWRRENATARLRDKILHPKSLIDKRGVAPRARIAVLGVDDVEFHRQLRSRTDPITRIRGVRHLDAVFFQADRASALNRLAALRTSLADILSAGWQAGLVDVKVVRFSAACAAHKFVIPKSQRR